MAQAIQGCLQSVGMDATVTQLGGARLAGRRTSRADMSLTPPQYIAVDPTR